MTVAAVLQGFVVLMSNLPKILSLLEALGTAFKNGERQFVVHLQLKKFDEAVDKAKEKGDTSGLEAIFNPPAKPKS